VSAQHGDLVTEHQDLDILGCLGSGEQRSELSTRANVWYASRKATARDDAARAMDGNREVARPR
jgi:hypothetical protein